MLWEPKPVFYRNFAERFVYSKLGSLFNYTKMVRTILEKEDKEYNYWLSHYTQFFKSLEDNGFKIEK